MADHDDTDALMTDDQARDELGGRTFDDAVEAGELRRVRFNGGEFLLRGDVDRVRDESDPGKLAARMPRL